jgi:hypothetical protein
MADGGFSNGAITTSDAATSRTNLSVPSTTGSGASGTWPISITGSSASVPNALTVSTGLQLNSGTTYDGSAAKSILIDSTVATLTGAQALTNKTISGSSNTLSNIGNSSLTNSSVTVNGTSIALGASGTVTAAAGTLTGSTLNSGVTASSLTSVGTLTNLTVTNPITGSVTGSSGSTSGNAATATALATARAINGQNFDGTVAITVPVNTTSSTTNASFFPLFVSSSSNGNQSVNLGTSLTFNPSTNNLSTTTFTGALSGNASTATTATNATNTAITDDTTTNATMYPTWVTASTGNLPQKTASTKLTLNPSTGVLSSTSFTGAGTGLTGTASSLTAGNVTTNANLTGVITSSGNATSIASQTGTGTKFVVDNSPTLTTPAISGAATLTSTGTSASLTLTTSTTGSSNEAQVTLVRGDQANGYAQNHYLTGASEVWATGLRAGDTKYHWYQSGSSDVMTLTTAGILNLTNLTVSSAVATDSSKNLISVTNTGSGNNVLATSPTLTTPLLGTPTSGVLINCTSLPAASINSATVTSYSPTLGDGTTNFTMTTQTGEWWTIAGKTTFSAHVDWSSKNGVTAAIRMSLPVVSTTALDSTAITIAYANGMPSGAYLMANVDPGVHQVVFHKIVAGVTSNLTAADLSSSGGLVVGGTYY